MSIMPDTPQTTWLSESAATPAPQADAPARSHARRRTASRNNLVLAALFVGGLAVIGLLHIKAGPAKASAASVDAGSQADVMLELLHSIKKDCQSDKAGSIVNQFYYDSRKRQIPADHLAGNPFRLILPAVQAPVAVVQETPASSAPDPEVVALSAAQERARELTLQSVLTGSNGSTAMISNNVLTVGQKIQGWTVVEIAPRQVVLQWKSHRHILTMK